MGRAAGHFECRRHDARHRSGSFDDFVSQVLHPEGDRIGLPTLFFPMLRIERIALDEARGSIPSLAEMFEKKVGRSLGEYLAQFA